MATGHERLEVGNSIESLKEVSSEMGPWKVRCYTLGVKRERPVGLSICYQTHMHMLTGLFG